MQIIIQRIPCSSFGFEYNTSYNTSSGNSIVYSLVQHLSEIYGDIASINNSSSLPSSCSNTPSTTMQGERLQLSIGLQVEYPYHKMVSLCALANKHNSE
jgi:hypothetical protein